MCGGSGSPKMQKEQVRVSVDPRKHVSGANRMDPRNGLDKFLCSPLGVVCIKMLTLASKNRTPPCKCENPALTLLRQNAQRSPCPLDLLCAGSSVASEVLTVHFSVCIAGLQNRGITSWVPAQAVVGGEQNILLRVMLLICFSVSAGTVFVSIGSYIVAFFIRTGSWATFSLA